MKMRVQCPAAVQAGTRDVGLTLGRSEVTIVHTLNELSLLTSPDHSHNTDRNKCLWELELQHIKR